eukprot:Skav214362  [mRNA]  locus=scaffold86:566965:572600:+ [translate_table: standard]
MRDTRSVFVIAPEVPWGALVTPSAATPGSGRVARSSRGSDATAGGSSSHHARPDFHTNTGTLLIFEALTVSLFHSAPIGKPAIMLFGRSGRLGRPWNRRRWTASGERNRLCDDASTEVLLQKNAGLKLTRENFQNILKALGSGKRSGLITEAFATLLRNSNFVLSERDYTVGIAACGRSKLWQHACWLLDTMPKAKVGANIFTYNAVLSACQKGSQWQKALNFFETMRRVKVKEDVMSHTAIIGACDKGSRWQQALRLFDEMQEAKVIPNVVSYSAAISAVERGGDWQQALMLFGAMKMAAISPDVISYGAMISACKKMGQWRQAFRCLEEMEVAKVTASAICFNAAISACERGMEWQQALLLLRGMEEVKVTGSVISYNATISACEKGGEWTQALWLLDAMQKNNATPDLISWNATISACEKGRVWQHALYLLDAMQESKISPDVISRSATISACEKGGQWQQALGLFEAMCAAKGSPDVISYSAAISASEKGAQWQMALNLFHRMWTLELVPDVISYSATISACEKDGQWEQALGLLPMLKKSLEFQHQMLDLHQHSEASACLTLRWWLSNTVAEHLKFNNRLDCVVVTANGKSQGADVQTATRDLLKKLKLDSRIFAKPSRIINIRTPLRPCSKQRSKEFQDDIRCALEEQRHGLNADQGQSAELLRVALQRRHACPRDHVARTKQ